MSKTTCKRPISNTRLKLQTAKPLAYDIANDLMECLSLKPFETSAEMLDSYHSIDMEADVFRNHYLKSEILSKYDSHPLGIDTKKAALEKFWEAEEMCKATNLSFTDTQQHMTIIFGHTRAAIIHMAREKIARVLGPWKWSELAGSSHFSGGASTHAKRAFGSPTFKWAGAAECSSSVRPILESFLEYSVVVRDEISYRTVNYNKATTVPKNSKTDRMIAMEPAWNMFFQLGAGSMIRRRLRRVGIDLNDQSRNQRLAREGAINNTLATIDLSMASDTIAGMVVYDLLPRDWFDAFDRLRSHRGYVDGTPIAYEKFSSMGNGFTFELETLIFWALASVSIDLTASESVLSVYGDDIIIPSTAAECLYDILSGFGFKPNLKKSFHTGPFRESCGKHYHGHADVTPFYIRSKIETIPDLIKVLNNLYRWSTINGVMDPRVVPVYRKYVSMLPKFWRQNTIPDGYGDYALVGSLVSNPHKKHVPHSGYMFKCKGWSLVEKPKARDELGSFYWALSHDDGGYGETVLTDPTPHYKEITILISGTTSAQYGYNP